MPSLPQDKANHCIYGAVIFLAVYFLLSIWLIPHAAYAALAVSALVGLGKEIADAWANYKATGNWRTGPHGVEGLDAAATAAGGFALFVAVWIAGGVK